ncbi:hypothetical protein [Candidatus Kryptobacter tengchongensis]|uniref:hypothetical protein n=1 Tax=Kryptobacter tengchongensis TaxID=1643429 RepID=UPI0013521080|nr:hypothetical protein [Candidatus Kryptobacter tengchongensis]
MKKILGLHSDAFMETYAKVCDFYVYGQVRIKLVISGAGHYGCPMRGWFGYCENDNKM